MSATKMGKAFFFVSEGFWKRSENQKHKWQFALNSW